MNLAGVSVLVGLLVLATAGPAPAIAVTGLLWWLWRRS